jgi:hypothetical protein
MQYTEFVGYVQNRARLGTQGEFERVAKRENIDMPDTTHHARAVISVLPYAQLLHAPPGQYLGALDYTF